MSATPAQPEESSDVLDLLLVCSSGGHLIELLALESAWGELQRAWVTFDTQDAAWLLRNEAVIHAFSPTNRHIPNLLRNLWLAIRTLRSLRPRAVLSTGAGVALPFLWIARLYGARTIYVESLTRIHDPSLTLRLSHRFIDHIYVQWSDLLSQVPNARYSGTVLGDLQ